MAQRVHKQRPRRAGVFCPVSSLPGPFGIGDFGPSAFDFIDWLVAARQTYWQVLPLSIPDHVGSPYSSPACQAGNWLLISPEKLRDDGFLQPSELGPARRGNVNYSLVNQAKKKMLEQAWHNFVQRQRPAAIKELATFVSQNSLWLDTVSVFLACKDEFGGRAWIDWPKAFRTLEGAKKNSNWNISHRRSYHTFVQWQWAKQWQAVRAYAHKRGVTIIGDLPFYVPLDSVEVWSQPKLFLLDRHGHPTTVSGVPPDYFSKFGQRWGGPVYHWAEHRRTKYRWWIERLRGAERWYDEVRFDHFRGLVASWHIPVRAKDARHGHWAPGPGRELLTKLKTALGRLPLVVEDLGVFSQNIENLRRRFSLPAVRVLLFGWSGLPHNIHHPDWVSHSSVYYSSNHDTNTAVGWWQKETKKYHRRHVAEFLHRPVKNVAWDLLDVLHASRSYTAMAAVQDVLGLSSSARINRPGTKRNNWAWRLQSGQLTRPLARRLAALTQKHHRAVVTRNR